MNGLACCDEWGLTIYERLWKLFKGVSLALLWQTLVVINVSSMGSYCLGWGGFLNN